MEMKRGSMKCRAQEGGGGRRSKEDRCEVIGRVKDTKGNTIESKRNKKHERPRRAREIGEVPRHVGKGNRKGKVEKEEEGKG